MDRSTALAALEADSARIVELGSSGALALDAPIAACPEWTGDDLLRHVARIYNWAGTILLDRLQEAPGRDDLPRTPDGVGAVDWLADRRARLLEALDETAEGEVVWNFFARGPGPAGFWLRRQLHETAIHRVDAEVAAEVEIAPFDPALAADGVSERFGFGDFALADELPPGAGPTVHLHATDAEGATEREWTVDVATGTLTLAHAKGDVALRGPAWSINRWLWGRPAGDELEVYGDGAVATDWQRAIAR